MSGSGDGKKKGAVHLVVQRYRSCKLLLNETEWVSQGADVSSSADETSSHCGLLLYVSLAAEADDAAVVDAATSCLNLPVLTSGLWGDGTLLFSIQQCLAQEPSPMGTTSITIVPQANLICKVKSQGQSIQYHGQIARDKGEALYSLFVDTICAAVFERQCQRSDKGEPQALPAWFTTWKAQRLAAHDPPPPSLLLDPSTPPLQLFASDSSYGAMDPETGLPLTTADGQPLTKSAVKKVRKILDGHVKRHDKWLQTHGAISTECCVDGITLSNPDESSDVSTMETIDWDTVLDASFCRVVAGTFGKRQGLHVQSDMGPFCHVMQL